jgi:hypothetical protein
MNHLLLGASIPFLIATIVYIRRKFRASIIGLIVTPIFMSMTMTLAIAPDLPRLFGLMDLYNQLLRDPRCNIFFWHFSIDNVETESVWQSILLVLMWGLLLFAAWRELMLREKGN